MRTLAALVFLLGCSATLGADRKPIDEVDLSQMTMESQVIAGTNSTFELAWWIPAEYWEIAFTQDPSVPDAQVKEFLNVLRPYSVLAVVQGDISNFGAFSFLDRDTLMQEMSVEIVKQDGTTSSIPHTEASDPDLRILLDMMKPVLANAIGNMGENLYFFPLPDTDSDGERLVSPYDPGVVRVQLAAREDSPPPVLDIEFPLDSLFVPRVCPNGKPAHVSWAFCPWSGEKLK